MMPYRGSLADSCSLVMLQVALNWRNIEEVTQCQQHVSTVPEACCGGAVCLLVQARSKQCVVSTLQVLDLAEKVKIGALLSNPIDDVVHHPQLQRAALTNAKAPVVAVAWQRSQWVVVCAGTLRDASAAFLQEFLAAEPRLAWTL
jgi:hypothetical protein